MVNNAGCVLLPGGYGADRGFLERDEGQYDRQEEIFAWCGAAVLLSCRYLRVNRPASTSASSCTTRTSTSRGEAGPRAGATVYVPKSTVSHVHTASSVEGSRLFQHYVERNRLLTLARNAPPGFAVSAGARYLAITASYARRDILSPILHGHPATSETVRRRLGAFSSYLRLLPEVVTDRRRLRGRKRVDDHELIEWTGPG